MPDKKKPTSERVIDTNIKAIHDIRQEADRNRRLDQKFIDTVVGFTGSTNSLYAHILVYGICLHFFQSFEKLSMLASLEAMFLAVFVLINQNRMNLLERRNADLHLQTSLLTDHKLTRLTATVDLIIQNFEIERKNKAAPIPNEESRVKPDEVLQLISDHEEKAASDSAREST